MRAILGRVMLYTGIDYHKRYSVVSTMDAAGTRVREARIDQNEPAAFAAYFQKRRKGSGLAHCHRRLRSPRSAMCKAFSESSSSSGNAEPVRKIRDHHSLSGGSVRPWHTL